ncbi:hypothetical protein FJ651_10550 [Paucihalobacter ruber]|uniref:Uncharacterized protein n=1 Tax=Paucihalobacter ruber TaxID=2567861 RepID=A0A506PI37_9FLAO|nr:hypothetical protein [Paucihalobacter ruber]TPV32747.1 hypothetical protein FJ651_10550 [Paucihalobacter ruber]
MNTKITTVNLIITLILLIFSSTSCTQDDDQPVDEIAQMIDEVRELTTTFSNHSAAQNAGWNNQMSPCVQHPTEGGMGIHFGRMEFFDGRINHLEPQVLLYAPNNNGDLEFLGVEYIIPFGILPESEPAPMLFDEEYKKNHELEIWALHVWTEKENPNGMFYDWNPNVNCN